MKRVVITGLGVLSPIGNDIETFLQNLKAGRHGFTLEEWFPGQSEEKWVSARVKGFTPAILEPYFEKKELRRTDKLTQYAVYAAKKALEDSGCDWRERISDPYRCGVITATGVGGIETTEEQLLAYHNKGHRRVSVFTIPMMIGNMAPGVIAIKTGFRGSNYCPVSACSSSAHALGEAFRAIKHGYLDMAVTGGVEACTIGFAYAGFNNMTALTTSKDTERASIPFDKERNGFVLGEGAGMLVLEEYEQAKARGAKIYAEIAGYGSTCDAYHETSPNPDGSGGAKAMDLAVQEAGIKPEEVNYINAHGTSTPPNDRTETTAVKLTFGEHAYKLAINSTKSLTGHLLGAAGGVEAIATVLQIKHSFVHQTAGYKIPDPECDLDYVTGGMREAQINAAVSNSLGFGGHNVSLCFKKGE
ncbi:MAG: beta-ketoacyl-ACP synthase II [Oscillospiraceae bacterium]|nr:beta-ketoacyl-ACP synthase II [Oscillospiraceae bacterium]